MKIQKNPNKMLVGQISQELKNNGGYCPSKEIHKKENKCLCKNYIEQDYSGECECGLYIKIIEN